MFPNRTQKKENFLPCCHAPRFYPKNLFTSQSHPSAAKLNSVYKAPEATQAWRDQENHPKDWGTQGSSAARAKHPAPQRRTSGTAPPLRASADAGPQHPRRFPVPTLRSHHPDHRTSPSRNKNKNGTAHAEDREKTRFFLALGMGLKKIKHTYTSGLSRKPL